MLSQESIEMYKIVISALDYCKKVSESINDELKKTQKTYSDHLLEMFQNDVDLIPKNIEDVNRVIKLYIDNDQENDMIPSYVRKHEKIISSCLSIYKRDLEELKQLPKNLGFLESEMPNITQKIDQINKIVGALNLQLS